MNTTELLEKAVSAGASDIFVVAGAAGLYAHTW